MQLQRVEREGGGWEGERDYYYILMHKSCISRKAYVSVE